MNDTRDEHRQEARAARDRLSDTVGTVKSRLRPASLSREIKGKARTKALDLASDAASAVKSRPRLIAAIAAAATVLILHRPASGLIKRISKEK